ncbi:Cyanovirin-N [Mycena galopus ATCC 62051]|nr:Cyanovirin-N [Mycena galopus ATCC 62051]
MHALLSSVLLALYATTALASPLEQRKEDTNFSATCINIVVNTGSLTLTANCQNSEGVIGGSETIGLDSCIGNDNGELVAHSNDFSASCSSISASGIELSAACRTPSGTVIDTSIDLNVVFSNTNGIIICP